MQMQTAFAKSRCTYT